MTRRSSRRSSSRRRPPGRTGVRVFTGTVPDYTSNAKGLLLGGVVGGGPAEQAGLQKGDVIVEIAGQTIANIYDYTYALELLKIDQPVKVVYMRGIGEAGDDADARRAALARLRYVLVRTGSPSRMLLAVSAVGSTPPVPASSRR